MKAVRAFTVSEAPDSAWFTPSSQEAAILSVLFKNNPQTFNSYDHASLGLCFKTFNTAVGNIIPKRHPFF